jgi:HSP20 family molecular chaperone IbpA
MPLAPSSAFDDVRRVMETMENLLESPMLLAHTGTTIPLDVVEKPTLFEVKADLPGFVKSDVKIEVKDAHGEPGMGPMLILTAESKFENEVREGLLRNSRNLSSAAKFKLTGRCVCVRVFGCWV